ncbi:MAG: electron transport complex subunit E [Turicibacter sp.]|nr:electron transport complex subunit E [Turicibacter sp.]MEE1237015.1 electron transport complex subunit E [Turicibacter sp.]
MNKKEILRQGLFTENPVFVLLLGMCPTLGVTTTLQNAIGMGLSVLFVLLFSNFVISSLQKVIPDQVRIPSFIVIIATGVTVLEMLLQAYLPDLANQLGIFIPLIVVNCIILGRAESFASKNKISDSLVDALGMGLGFTLGLVILGGVRELIGTGSLLGFQLLPEPISFPILSYPAGAFLTMGLIIAIFNAYRLKIKVVK